MGQESSLYDLPEKELIIKHDAVAPYFLVKCAAFSKTDD
jgi:hypothetical protein